MQTITVSALNEQIKYLLEESFSRVFVQGELSRITFHNSGHIYFTLKDKDSAISCVMFRGNASKLKFRLEEGLSVVIDGALTLYKPRGSYQINCFSIEPAGQGALALAYEQLKQKLSQKGYFDINLKKQLPKFPKKIALITSATSAGLQDMLRVANQRYRAVEIDIYDTLVQGDNAKFSIVEAIKKADSKNYDIIIVGRGGGSIEDLWAFNEEIVADAIYEAKTPIISAVGHEIDYVISDFVADVRASTPTNAMQIALPDTTELYQFIDSLASNMTQTFMQKVAIKQQELQHLKNSFLQHSVEKKLIHKQEEIKQLKSIFSQTIQNKLNMYENKIENAKNMLHSNNPKFKLKKGYVQLSKNQKVIEMESLSKNDEFEIMDSSVKIKAKVLEKVSF